MTIKVKKADLLAALEKNRADHKRVFEEGTARCRGECVQGPT